MERCRAAFNKSFGFLFRRFRSVDLEILYSLFNSFFTSFYGCELWLNRKKCSFSFKQVTVSYHGALKKMLQVPRFYNNHFVCSIFNALTFENLVNFRTVRFYKWMESCSSPCFRMHKTYFFSYFIFIFQAIYCFFQGHKIWHFGDFRK